MTAPAATSDAVRTSELRRFGGGCVVGRSAAARQARLVAAMAQTIPCWGMRMAAWESALLSLVVVQNCCQPSVASVIDVQRVNLPRVTACTPKQREEALAQLLSQLA